MQQNGSSNYATERQRSHNATKDREKRKTHAQLIEEVGEQEHDLFGKLDNLMNKMDDFEMRAQAYKLNGLEITRKAVAFQKERNRRLRERNSIVDTNI